MIKHGLSAIAVVWACIVLSSPVRADEAQANVNTAADNGNLAEIIVTATKRAERLQDVPITVVALTADDFEAGQVRTTRDLLLTVPGLVNSSAGPFFQPNIRGVTSDFTGPGQDSPIATYLDGVYMPSQEGNVFDLPDVREVEVLKGPQGTLFGRNATGGAILISTLDPSFTFSGKANVSDGQFFGGTARTANEQSGSLFITAPLISNILAGSLSAYGLHTKGYITNDVDGGETGKVQSEYVHGKLLFTPVGGVKFVLGVSDTNRYDYASNQGNSVNGVSSATGVNPATGTLYFPGSITATVPWHTIDDPNFPTGVNYHTFASNLRGDIDFSAGTLTSITGFSRVHPRFYSDVENGYGSPVSCFIVYSCFRVEVTQPDQSSSQEFDFASKKFSGFSFVSGLYLYQDSAEEYLSGNNYPALLEAEKTEVGFTDPFTVHSNVKTNAEALFTEATYDLTDRFSVVAGGRYSWEHKQLHAVSSLTEPLTFIKSADFSKFTPRASVRFKFTNQLTAYATYSEGFKSGAFDAVTFTAPTIKPEDLKSYEIGLKASESDYSLNLSAFYYHYTNLQVKAYVGITPIFQNAATAEMYGLDLDGSYRITSNFTLRGGVSWLPRANYTQFPGAVASELPSGEFGLPQAPVNAAGFRIFRSPRTTANLSAIYSAYSPVGEIRPSADIYYSSSYTWGLLPSVETNAYTTINAQVGLVPPGSNLTLGIFVRNLTNASYIQNGTESSNILFAVYAPPREVGVSLECKF